MVVYENDGAIGQFYQVAMGVDVGPGICRGAPDVLRRRGSASLLRRARPLKNARRTGYCFRSSGTFASIQDRNCFTSSSVQLT